MEPKLKMMNWFVRLITFGWPSAITFAPWGIYFKKMDYILYYPIMVNHEKIHWKQQLEMLLIFFYLWYAIEWIVRLLLWPFTLFSKNWYPYNNLSVEREAHSHQYNLNYLNERKSYSWMKYIFKK